MAENKVFYYGIIKQAVGAFGALFSNMHILRRKDNSVKGEVMQDIKVPIAFAQKEKWLQQFVADPAKATQVNISLPRMAYEMTGFSYDTSRKQTRSGTIACKGEDIVPIVRTPAPWNMELALYIVGNKQEDCLQILEQILPTFNPDYTIRIKTIPEMNIVTSIPIALTSVSPQDEYQGDYVTQRIIVYTLTFTMKLDIYGKAIDYKSILDSEIDIGDTAYRATYDEESGSIVETIESADSSLSVVGSIDNSPHLSPKVIVREPQAEN